MRKTLTPELGIHGLKNLDAVILAALASNATVLLIGPHGSAKTLLARRIAETLGCAFRHYNTSLLNYDDLVGYPIPDPGNRTLNFIQTPGTIWNAEFILFDEISRARPEIQNKVFPIVHEHRVQGIELQHLSHCWAAMNPPSDGEEAHDAIYFGSWSLDAALADRFRFVLRVPGFNELQENAREEIMLNGDENKGRPALKSRIEAVRKQLNSVDDTDKHWLVRYLSAMIPLLEKAEITISGRRARYLFENVLALHAAERVLGERSELGDVALRGVFAGLPHSASGKTVEHGKILLAHKQAILDAGAGSDSIISKIRRIKDPVKRAEVALREKPDKPLQTQIFSDAFASLSLVERYAWVHRVFPRISENAQVGAAVLEMMAEVESKIHDGAHAEFSESMDNSGKRWKFWQDLSESIARFEEGGDITAEHVAVARALFFIEEETVPLEKVAATFADIDERISSCA
jgi:MoxR-like ATPase